jgi:hypothetical protein
MTVRRRRRSLLEDCQNVTVRIDLAFMPACHLSCLRFPSVYCVQTVYAKSDFYSFSWPRSTTCNTGAERNNYMLIIPCTNTLLISACLCSTCANVFAICAYRLMCVQRVCEQRGTKEWAATWSAVPHSTPTLPRCRETHRRDRLHGMRSVA